MMLIWTKASNPISLLIRSITREDCSHFAFVFNTRAKGVMFESNFLGTHLKFFEASKKKFSIVKQIDLDLNLEVEEMVWSKLIEKYDGKRYDFGGAIFLGVSLLLNRWFGKKLPERNLWADPNAYFCNEVYEALDGVPGLPTIPVSNGLETPYMVWTKVNGAISNG